MLLIFLSFDESCSHEYINYAYKADYLKPLRHTNLLSMNYKSNFWISTHYTFSEDKTELLFYVKTWFVLY